MSKPYRIEVWDIDNAEVEAVFHVEADTANIAMCVVAIDLISSGVVEVEVEVVEKEVRVEER